MSANPTALTTAPAATGHVREGGISNVVLGMVLFITSEVMFFAGLFAAYFNVRAQAPAWPPKEFVGFLEWLPTAEEIIPVVTVATILLILSSVTCQMALRGIARGDHRALVRGIAVTFVLGATFIVMQGFDYLMLYSKGLRLDSGPYGTTFYTLTGFHGAHVIAGLVMLGVVLYRSMTGQFSAKHHDMVLATALYWDFVDVVWIVLFAVLYIIPNAG
jgi:cytochrome c oxidase subunit 3